MSKPPRQTRGPADDGDAVDAVVPPPSSLLRTDSGHVDQVGIPASQSAGPSAPEELSSRYPTGRTNTTPSSIPSTSGGPVPSADNHRPAFSAEALISSRQCLPTVNAAGDAEVVDGRDLVIEKVVPNRGPTTGGPEVCILGSNFPTDQMPLYARFGDNFARAVGMLSPFLGKCLIPARFFICPTRSCALSRKLVFQALLQ